MIGAPKSGPTNDEAKPRFLPGGHVVVAVALLAVLSLPLLLARPGPLSPEESGYISEALNLTIGNGLTDTTGELMSDQGPLFPALLAADFAIAGFSLDNARWLSTLFALGNAALLLTLGWRLFGREAGLMAAALALVSSLLIVAGTSLALDGAQTFFLLLTLLFLHPALISGKARWAALSGASLGLALLTRESAIMWLPLPAIAMLLLGRGIDRPGPLLAAYGGGLLLVAGWWWGYIYAVDGRVHPFGDLATAAPWLAAGATVSVLAGAAATLVARGGRAAAAGVHIRWLIAGLVVTAWSVLFLIGLERGGPPASGGLLASVPDYATDTLASWLRPLPLIVLAWGYVAYRAARGALSDRLLLLGLALFLPLALFVARRDLPVREILPLAYLSYLALGRAAIDFARWLVDSARETLSPAVAVSLASIAIVAGFGWFAVTETQRFDDYRSSFDEATIDQQHWDNPLVRDAAAWIEEHVPSGTPVMSSRLYNSHLYALTGGRYPWQQMPLVGLEFSGSPPAAVRTSDLSLREGRNLPAGPGEPWLHVRRVGDGFVALSEPDLLTEIVDREIRYLIVTGDDAGVSSLALLPYFDDQPAFREVAAFVGDESNQIHIYEIRLVDIDSTAPPVRVSRAAADALEDALGAKPAHDLLVGLSPGGYVITGPYGPDALSVGGP